MISIQISNGNKRKLVWDSPGQNLIDIPFKFQLKMKGNCSGTAQNIICVSSIQILIENGRKLVRDSPGQKLIDFF